MEKLEKLSSKQEAFINHYIMNHSVKEAARMVGVSYSTANRWLQHGLKQIIFDRQKDFTRSSLLILQTSIYKATQTLNDILTDSQAPPNIKLKACEIILSHAIPSIEITQIEERLNKLEILNKE